MKMDNFEVTVSITLKDIVHTVPVKTELNHRAVELLTPNVSVKLEKVEQIEHRSDDHNKCFEKMLIKNEMDEPVNSLVSNTEIDYHKNPHCCDVLDDQLFRHGDTDEYLMNNERTHLEKKFNQIKDSHQNTFPNNGVSFVEETVMRSHFCDSDDKLQTIRKESDGACREDQLPESGTIRSAKDNRTNELSFHASKEQSYTRIKEEVTTDEDIFQSSLIKSENIFSEVDHSAIKEPNTVKAKDLTCSNVVIKSEPNNFSGDVNQDCEFRKPKIGSFVNESYHNDIKHSFGRDASQQKDWWIEPNKNKILTNNSLSPSIESCAIDGTTEGNDGSKKIENGSNRRKQKVYAEVDTRNVYHKRTEAVERPFSCGTCDKTFYQFDHLTVHKKSHTREKTFACDICNKKFYESCHLKGHKRTHTGEKPFACEICNKSFTFSTSLTVHKRTHTGEKPYVCDICTKSFTNVSGLIRHKRTHTGGKPYACDICNKSYNISTYLMRHKRTHTRVKRFTCDICNMSFSRCADLIPHKITHTRENPFTCGICNMSFRFSSSLKQHKRTHIVI